MAPPTIFTRPRRQVQGATGAWLADQPVRTQDELLAAITRAAALAADSPDNGGQTITVVAPFKITQRITIPSTTTGLTIRGPGRLIAATAVVFDVDATDVTIENLQFTIASGSTVNTLVRFDGARGTASRLRLIGDNVSSGPAIDCQANDCQVIDNFVAAGIGGTAISVGAGATRGTAVIRGNNCGTSDIDTTGCGAGSNTIYGNTRTGTINAHGSGTDAVGLNT